MSELQWIGVAGVFITTALLLAPVNIWPSARQEVIDFAPFLVESWTAGDTFVYWAAHSLFSIFVVLVADMFWPGHTLEINVLGAWCAMVKEFGWDRCFESQYQTFKNNISDFAGYIFVGLPIADLLVYFKSFQGL